MWFVTKNTSVVASVTSILNSFLKCMCGCLCMFLYQFEMELVLYTHKSSSTEKLVYFISKTGSPVQISIPTEMSFPPCVCVCAACVSEIVRVRDSFVSRFCIDGERPVPVNAKTFHVNTIYIKLHNIFMSHLCE